MASLIARNSFALAKHQWLDTHENLESSIYKISAVLKEFSRLVGEAGDEISKRQTLENELQQDAIRSSSQSIVSNLGLLHNSFRVSCAKRDASHSGAAQP